MRRGAIDRAAAAALRLLPPEAAHRAALAALARLPVLPVRQPSARLRTEVFGHAYASPVGLAAGFDKDARVWRTFHRLGWGFVETGAVTPRPQPGNPKPRLFRLPGGGVVNHMGFNSCGLEPFRSGLETAAPRIAPVWVNFGANRTTADPVDDWERMLIGLVGRADAFTLNLSCPNSPNLASLRMRNGLRPALERMVAARDRAARGLDGPPPALLAKLSPDLPTAELRECVRLCVEAGLDGLVATNSSEELRRRLAPANLKAGGLSGRPLRQRSMDVLRTAYRETGGATPLVSVGGIATAADAYARIRAGASLLQLYSAMIWQGVGCGPRIAEGVAERLERDGFASVGEAVGVDADPQL